MLPDRGPSRHGAAETTPPFARPPRYDPQMAERRLEAIVPSVGMSPLLEACLGALKAQEVDVEIVLVDQGAEPVEPGIARLADRVLRQTANLGFATANNRALAAGSRPLVALVNDDVVVAPGWASCLLAALDRHPEAAAAQGTNLMLDEPTRVDGRGLAWNRRWQAVQIGRGTAADEPPVDGTREVFGVSATAAVYRREALDAVAFRDGTVLDERLGSYYEDVDLACRLRAAGYCALSVDAARAKHAGSTTGNRLPGRNVSLVYGNRHVVLARVLGRAFWPRLPGLLSRDLIDLVRAVLRGEIATAGGIAAGWGRALARVPRVARFGAPSPPLHVLGSYG